MKRTARLMGMLALLLAVAVSASAQETRGSIEGVVKDTSGAVMPGVTVEARSPALVGVATATTDTAGLYRFPALAPGRYEVTATLAGFQPAKVENIQLQLGQILKIDFALQIASVTEAIQVTAESPIIDVKQNAAAVSIEAELIERIPKGRNFTSVITTAPGANNEAKAGGIQIDGASGSENRFVIDGLDTTNLRTGVSDKEFLTDFVAEVQVKSSGYNAEYRATTGGVVSAITKTGSNSWHGDIGTYYQNDDWNGQVRPALRLNPLRQTEAEYTMTPRDPSSTTEPIFDIGGPVFQNKMWFFVGYVPQIERTERTVTFNTGDRRTATFNQDSEDHNLNYNVTSQITNDMRFKFSGSNERTYGGQSLPGKEPDGTSNSNAAQFPNPVTTNSTNDFYVGDLSWVVSPKFFLNTNVGYVASNAFQVTETEFQTELRHSFGQSNFCNPTAVPGSANCPFPEIPSNLQQLSGFSDLAASTRNVRDKYTRLGISLDGTYYANFGGQHTFKAGVQWERLGNDVLTGAQAPTVTLQWNASRTTLDEPPRQVRGAYGYYTVARSYTEGKIHSNNVGLYLQDAWTLNNRLTLNLGLRADSEEIPSYQPQNPGITFGFGDKLAPRVGFAYDLKGDGQWKAYGSWGMFYDIQKLEMPRGSWGADRWVDYHYTLDSFNWPAINCEGPVGSGCPGTFIELADRRHVANDPENFLVDPNLKPMRAQEFTLGLDHELTRTMSVGVRYAHKQVDYAIEDVGIQVAGVGEIFMIANPGYGIAEFTLAGNCPSCPAQPPAVRDYDGVEFRLRKRLSNGWSLNTSYLYSRLWGNYAGLASSDENGRTSPNVNRVFDGMYMSYDETGRPTYGRLQTDRPHQFKAQGTYEFKWGTGLGLNYYLESGSPQQSTFSMKSVPVFDSGRNNLGRTGALSQTDLLIYQDFRLVGSTRLHVNVNIDNLFDQDTVTRLFTTRYRDGLPVSDAQFFAGINTAALVDQLNSDSITSNNIRHDPRFRLSDQFLGARVFRVQAKFSF
jgi:outer membrane receptor protein involved in Fe transport